MVASAIFFLLFVTLLSGFQRRKWLTLLLFFACWISMALLFKHHVTDPLDVNL